MLTLKNLFISLFSILFALGLIVGGINPAMAQVQATPEQTSLITITIKGVSELAEKDEFAYKVLVFTEGGTCPNEVSMETPEQVSADYGVSFFYTVQLTDQAFERTQVGEYFSLGTYKQTGGLFTYVLGSCGYDLKREPEMTYQPVLPQVSLPPVATAMTTEKSPLVRKPDWRHFMLGFTPQTISLDGTKGGDTLGNFPVMDLAFGWAIAWDRPEGTGGFELQLVRGYLGGGFYSYLEESYVMPRVSLGQFYGPYVNLPKQWRLNTLLGWQVGRSPVMVDCSLVGDYGVNCHSADGSGEFQAMTGSPFVGPAGSIGFQHTGSDNKLTLGFELTAQYEAHVMGLVIGRMTVISPEGEQRQFLPKFAPGLYGQLLLLPAVTVSW